MPAPKEPQRERPSTYFVSDRSNQQEVQRIFIQDQLLTTSMGVFPEQPDPGQFHQVLDVGCGTGGWLLEVAKAYPHLSHLEGCDVSAAVVTYARAQMEEARVADRVHVQVMDALSRLDFAADRFDLVNLRLGMSFLRTWEWLPLLAEFQRVTCWKGVIRLTESDMLIQSKSPALTRLYGIALDAVYQAGHFFTPESDGVTSHLTRLLSQAGVSEVQSCSHTLKYQAGTQEGQWFFENMSRTFQTALPFYRKWSKVPDDYEAIYRQALKEMQDPAFVATWTLLTAWGSCDTPSGSLM